MDFSESTSEQLVSSDYVNLGSPFSEGDIAWSPSYGPGVIVSSFNATVRNLDNTVDQLIVFRSDEGIEFTLLADGRASRHSPLPVLFHRPIAVAEWPKTYKIPKLEMDHPVWVCDKPHIAWCKRHFAGFKVKAGKLIILVWPGGQTSHTTGAGELLAEYTSWSLVDPAVADLGA